jgi:hypothetical protein
MSRFYEGQTITLFLKGAGVVSQEVAVIESVEDGVVRLEDSDKEFDMDGKWLGADPFFGFDFWID